MPYVSTFRKYSPKTKKIEQDHNRQRLPRIIPEQEFYQSHVYKNRTKQSDAVLDNVYDMCAAEHLISKEENDACTSYFEHQENVYDGRINEIWARRDNSSGVMS